MKSGALVLCLGALGLGISGAPALGSRPARRVAMLPFSLRCTGEPPPRVAPVLRGVHAQVALGAGWRIGRAAANDTSSGGGCGQPYLVIDVPDDAGGCLQQTVYASAERSGSDTPASFIGVRYVIVARGRLAVISGMHGIWEEVQMGSTPAYPAYSVDAVYATAHDATLYELSVVPSPSYTGICRRRGPQARAIARQLAESFRVQRTASA